MAQDTCRTKALMLLRRRPLVDVFAVIDATGASATRAMRTMRLLVEGGRAVVTNPGTRWPCDRKWSKA